MLELNKLYCMDCMEGMRDFPDDYFDLAIVDPPYGLNIIKSGRIGKSKDYGVKEWDLNMPIIDYFIELQRISKDQIIWGGNYFPVGATRCYLVWDKKNSDRTFADCELAWTSFDSVSRMYRFHPAEYKEEKIHPTQKPEQLYKWILNKYATQDMKIIDTHVGSGSSIIAFIDFGCDWIGFEIDEDYHKSATERIERHKQQLKLF